MTANWNSVVDDSRNDIVFEGRNQDYGAYEIRRRYNWTVTLILGCMIGALALGMGIKFVLGLKGDEIAKEPILDMTTIDLTPPPADKNEPPPPPPPPPPPKGMSKGLKIGLIVGGSVLVLAIVGLVIYKSKQGK